MPREIPAGWPAHLAWVFAFVSSTALLEQGWSGDLAHIAESQAPGGAVYVYETGSAEPAIIPPGAPRWFDGSNVASLEWRFGASDPVAPVEAVAGGRRWPLQVDRGKRWAALPVTDEIREAWDSWGTLKISSEGGPVVELRWRPRRLLLGPDGEEFSARRRDSAFVPGSRDWVEVLLGDSSGGQTRLGVYTVDGETLARARWVRVGGEVPFQVGEENYVVQVGALDGSQTGEDSAQLRVKRHEETPEPAQTIRNKVTELIEQEIASAEHEIDGALTLLVDGKAEEAHTPTEAARRRLENGRRGLRWLQELASGPAEEAKYLSVIKARVVRARPHTERISEDADPLLRDWGRFVGRLFPSPMDIDAEILEVHAVGREYAAHTVLERRHPFRKRTDLVPGRTIGLSVYKEHTGFLIDNRDERREYWLVIYPSLSIKRVPRGFGTPGRSEIVLAMPVREP